MSMKSIVFMWVCLSILLAGNAWASCGITCNDYTSEQGFCYTISDSIVTITGYTGMDIDIVIPSTIDGLPVSSIGTDAFRYCTGLTSVTIPDSVTSIGSYAFSYSGLSNVIMPDSIIEIGVGSFSNCPTLTEIDIPNSVTSIGDYCVLWLHRPDQRHHPRQRHQHRALCVLSVAPA